MKSLLRPEGRSIRRYCYYACGIIVFYRYLEENISRHIALPRLPVHIASVSKRGPIFHLEGERTVRSVLCLLCTGTFVLNFRLTSNS
jgi:hypothetical protein